MDAEENQSQVSLRAHRLWKSLRDSHIPSAAPKAVEKWKAKGRLPTFPPQHDFPLYGVKEQKQGGLKRGATLPPSGSFFD